MWVVRKQYSVGLIGHYNEAVIHFAEDQDMCVQMHSISAAFRRVRYTRFMLMTNLTIVRPTLLLACYV